MKELKLIAIHEFEIVKDEMLELITAGGTSSPLGRPRPCGNNYCDKNTSECDVNDCAINSGNCRINTCGANTPTPPPCGQDCSPNIPPAEGQ